MSELRNILEDSVNRLFSDQLDWTALHKYEKNGWPTDLWEHVTEQGMDKVLASEEAGGMAGSWSDAYPIIRACGRYAVPVPLPETILAHWIAVQSNQALIEGVPSVFSKGCKLKKDKLILRNESLPWGGRADFLVGIVDGNVVIADTKNAVVSLQKNLGRDDRDILSGELEVITTYPTLLDNDTVHWLGALLRSAQIAGASAAALDLAVQYAGDREQFGRSLSKFQAIQHQLADLAGLVASVDAIAVTAFARLDSAGIGGNGRNARLEIAAAKCRASEAVEKITRISHQIHGAIGFTYEYGLHFVTRRLWAWRTEYGGVSEWGENLGRAAVKASGDGIWPIITK
jgi:acyl-CoA dehydrogenase